MITTIWDHRLHKIDDERNGCGIGRMRDENLVKKGLIIFVGPQKTGKYVITRNGEEIVASLMRGGDRSSVTQRDIRQGVFWKLEGDMTKSLTKSENSSDVVNDVVLYMSITKEGTDG